MKKILLIAVALATSLLMINCSDDTTPSYILNLTISLPDGFTLSDIPDGGNSYSYQQTK